MGRNGVGLGGRIVMRIPYIYFITGQALGSIVSVSQNSNFKNVSSREQQDHEKIELLHHR